MLSMLLRGIFIEEHKKVERDVDFVACANSCSISCITQLSSFAKRKLLKMRYFLSYTHLIGSVFLSSVLFFILVPRVRYMSERNASGTARRSSPTALFIFKTSYTHTYKWIKTAFSKICKTT